MNQNQKTYLLDTSVLLYDSESIYNFEDNEIIIPREVLLELNKKKSSDDQIGKNARDIIKNLRKIFLNKLDEKVFDFEIKEKVSNKISSEGTITLYFDKNFFYPYFKINKNNPLDNNFDKYSQVNTKINNEIKNATDLRLINIARQTKSILVTKDYTLQLLAMQMGVPVEDYTTDQTLIAENYKGYKTITTSKTIINKLYSKKKIDFDKENKDLINNQLIELQACDAQQTALAKYSLGKLNLIERNKSIHGIRAKNREQIFAVELLMDPSISLITISGISGTGKTLLSLITGLEQVSNLNIYNKLTITRPTVSVGNEIGFLPGTLEEKLKPWMKPIYDNFDYISNGNGEEIIDRLKTCNKLQIEPLQYIRGRSIPNQFMIIDEAQNLSPRQIKTVISRAGKDTKIILTGDIDQIDQPYLSKRSNALSYVIDKFMNQDNYGHVEMRRSERSRLAEQASQLL
ncbi:MAG: PhoH family protein [Bacillota bacterium]